MVGALLAAPQRPVRAPGDMHEQGATMNEATHSVLFVCRANLCRSPMAACLLRDLLSRRGDPGAWRIESAGAWAQEGAPAAPLARRALGEWGLDLPDHRSRSVSRELLQGFQLTLAMERGQAEALRAEFPDLAPRVYLLSEMAGRGTDLPDPPDGRLVEVLDLARRIRELLVQGLERVLSLAHRMLCPRR